MKPGLFLIILITILSPVFCKKKDVSAHIPFTDQPQAVLLKGDLNEVSGIADSENNPGYCWVQEDSGNPPQIILLGHDGIILKKVLISGAVNRDWEDIVLSVTGNPVKPTLYIGDFGDNAGIHNNYSIYRFQEPLSKIDTVYAFDKINFQYPDKAHDAEAMFIDKVTGDIYIITKRDAKSRIYRLSFPQQINTVITATYITELPYNGVVSAAISPDGREIIIKTYNTLYYYKKSVAEPFDSLFNKPNRQLNYTIEPQGEAIGFASNGKGFFTLSEKAGSSSVNLYYYKRN